MSKKKLKPLHFREPTATDFVDREVAWLNFNDRVLHQALDPNVPLLERVRFLGIFHSNLDEFYMKRIGRIRERDSFERPVMSIGRLKQLHDIVQQHLDTAAHCYRTQIIPALAKEGISFTPFKSLSAKEKKLADEVFRNKIFPILTPLAVDPGHPFPHISNQSTSLAVSLRYPKREDLFFARIKIPEVFPHLIPLDVEADGKVRFISVRDIVAHNLDQLFPHMEVVSTMPFRVIRNIETDREDNDAEDLLQTVAQHIHERQFGEVVKMEVPQKPDEWLMQFLMNELDITQQDVYSMREEIDFRHLAPITQLRRPDLLFKPWIPVAPPALGPIEGASIFDTISQHDVLVHHPFESFSDSVEKFIHTAANDPQVLAIKMTLYRTNEQSNFIRSLKRAAEAGKQVVVLIELQARFDEKRNIQWATQLEDAGAHVVYGVMGLKTHSKTALVVRHEAGGLRCYAHIGTGNYHAQTAKLYTDLGLFTADPSITEDIVELFHHLSGRSLKKDYKRLLVAPYAMKEKFLQMIQREIDQIQKGKPAGIIIKVNNLEDQDICTALYRASQAGVPVELIVRTICTLTPGVAGLSDNIRVYSIVDRFLEHSRIFFFRNGSDNPIDGEFYIGSADLMYRNLLGRVEVVTPILKLPLRERVWQTLKILLADTAQSWEMQSDGSYKRRSKDSNNATGAQGRLMKLARDSAKETT